MDLLSIYHGKYKGEFKDDDYFKWVQHMEYHKVLENISLDMSFNLFEEQMRRKNMGKLVDYFGFDEIK